MADITQTIPSVDEYTVTPSRNNPSTFFEDRETRLSEETTRIPQQNTQATALNTFASQANSLKSEVNGFRNDAANSNTGAQQAKDTAVSASNSAVAAKNAIDGYVIPTEATYNKDGIDLRVKSLFKRSGYTKEISREERWQVGTTPNTITDIGGDAINIDGVLYERSASENLVLPLAPFATGSTDELITDGGITTGSSHSAGDIVVSDDSELVTNGTFDSDVSGWDVPADNYAPVISWDTSIYSNGSIKMVCDETYDNITQTISNLKLNTTYTLSFNYTVSSGTFYISVNGTTLDFSISGSGTYTKTFTTGSVDNGKKLGIASNSGAGVFYFDNISLKLEYGGAYRAIASTTAGDLLSNTAKFEAIDFVTRLDVFYSTATGYGSFKGYKDFTATELNEGGSDLIANRYSDRFTKISENCYLLDGTTKVTNLQVSGARLNGGAYEPNFNPQGSRKFSDNNFWYNTTDTVNSVYDCF